MNTSCLLVCHHQCSFIKSALRRRSNDVLIPPRVAFGRVTSWCATTTQRRLPLVPIGPHLTSFDPVFQRRSTLQQYTSPLKTATISSISAVVNNLPYQTRHYVSRRKQPYSNEHAKVVKRLPKHMCKLEFCHTKYDLRDYFERIRGWSDSDEDMDNTLHKGIFTVRFGRSHIMNKAIDYYGKKKKALVRQQLQYYSMKQKRWVRFPFANIYKEPDFTYYKGKGSRPIPLRVLSEYQDADGSLSAKYRMNPKYEKMIAVPEDRPKVWAMLCIIRHISQRMIHLEYHRTPEDKYVILSKIVNVNSPVPILHWLTEQMKIDYDLRQVVISLPGALQHITTCLAEHDSLWVPDQDPFFNHDL
jgi:hypothetical protein